MARLLAWNEFNKKTGIDWEKFKRLLDSELAALTSEKS